ncbi:hypothetical protein HK102_013658 [Quaeritorhiza haematococci]|nr:hypothetical protein HK102_013658 [Quaeritorhiza haematococci]
MASPNGNPLPMGLNPAADSTPIADGSSQFLLDGMCEVDLLLLMSQTLSIAQTLETGTASSYETIQLTAQVQQQQHFIQQPLTQQEPLELPQVGRQASFSISPSTTSYGADESSSPVDEDGEFSGSDFSLFSPNQMYISSPTMPGIELPAFQPGIELPVFHPIMPAPPPLPPPVAPQRLLAPLLPQPEPTQRYWADLIRPMPTIKGKAPINNNNDPPSPLSVAAQAARDAATEAAREKRRQRRILNTAAARRARQRKSEKIETYTEQVSQLEDERSELNLRIAVLEAERRVWSAREEQMCARIQKLEQQNADLSQAVASVQQQQRFEQGRDELEREREWTVSRGWSQRGRNWG